MDPSSHATLNAIRRTVLQMVFNGNEGHIPSAFSVLDILYVLYRDCLHFDPHDPRSPDRDRFVLSKGHASAGLYAVLSHFGFFPQEMLLGYCQPGSILGGHPDATMVPGIEASTGSLGHGVAIAVGMALGLRQQGSARKVVVLVGDGEMDEGSFWEAMMMIQNTELKNIVVIADCNASQRYSHKYAYDRILKEFDFGVSVVEGHDLDRLSATLQPLVCMPLSRPAFVMAQTTKGQGVARFIGDHGWHRRTPTDAEMALLLEELR